MSRRKKFGKMAFDAARRRARVIIEGAVFMRGSDAVVSINGAEHLVSEWTASLVRTK